MRHRCPRGSGARHLFHAPPPFPPPAGALFAGGGGTLGAIAKRRPTGGRVGEPVGLPKNVRALPRSTRKGIGYFLDGVTVLMRSSSGMLTMGISMSGISLSASPPAALMPAMRPNVRQRPWFVPGQMVG